MKNVLFFVSLLFSLTLLSQNLSNSPWHIQAVDINPNRYYGITVANGMVGLVSSPEPMKVKDVVLNGVYDYYQRGRVSNILKTFSHMNMHLEVDGHRVNRTDISNYTQTLDMRGARLSTTYEVGEKVNVRQDLMSLRNLPFTAMSIIEITAKQACEITPVN